MKSNWLVGSPPRVREKLIVDGTCVRCLRITPACAGKTLYLPPLLAQNRDHPRVCGKNKGISQLELAKMGSPPRVREKQLYPTPVQTFLGITPACAGKTPKVRYLPSDFRDHPRVCGKNLTCNSCIVRTSGSPPRVREKQKTQPHSDAGAGITPACAGKT